MTMLNPYLNILDHEDDDDQVEKKPEQADAEQDNGGYREGPFGH